MSDQQSNGTGGRGRRGKRFLSPREKYELWMSLVRGEYTIAGAAERAGVDRSTVMKLRMVARQGALDALASCRPGGASGQRPGREAGRGPGRDRAVDGGDQGDGRQVDVGRGKGRWD